MHISTAASSFSTSIIYNTLPGYCFKCKTTLQVQLQCTLFVTLFISAMSNPPCVLGFLCETSDGDGIIWLFHYLLTMNILTNAFTQSLLSSHWVRETEWIFHNPTVALRSNEVVMLLTELQLFFPQFCDSRSKWLSWYLVFFFFLRNICIFIQQGCIPFIKSDSRLCYKRYLFQINAVHFHEQFV